MTGSRQYRARDLRIPPQHPYANVDDLGIAVAGQPHNRDQLHIGLLYKTDSGQCRICHLAAHFDFKDDEASVPMREGVEPFRWIQVQLDPTLRRATLGVIGSVVKASKNGRPIGYSLEFTGNYFGQAGEYLRQQPEGLTCSTFVLAIFRTLEIELLDTESWRAASGSDLMWQQNMAEVLSRRFPVLRQDFFMKVGCARFQPEQVAAAAATLPRPLKFEEALALAEKVRRDVRKSYN